MKKLLIIAAMAFAMLFVSCKDTDTLTFTNMSPSSGGYTASYKVDVGNSVKRGKLRTEFRHNGIVETNGMLNIGKKTDSVEISFLTADGRLNVQISAEGEESQSAGVAYDLPDGTMESSFIGYSEGEVIEVSDGELILAAIVFGTGDGVKSVDLKSLADAPEKPADHTAVMIIRAAFE